MINKTKRNTRKTNKLLTIKVLSLLVFGFLYRFSYSQQIDNYAPKKKWSICLQLAGSSCGSSPCLSDFETWSKKNPCELYDYRYYSGNPPVKTKAVCCGDAMLARPTNPENGLITYNGYPLYVALDTFQLMAHCVDGEGNENEQILVDFTAAIPNSWETVILNLFVANDSVVIEAYKGDSFPPYYKSSSKITLKYGPYTFSNVCSGSAVPFNQSTGIEFYTTAKVTTHFKPNPLKGEKLKFEMINEDALKDNIKFSFYNSIGQLIFEYIPKEAEGEIDLSKLPNGVYTILVKTDYSEESTKIVINR